jgi:two-component system CheB/CheR fusion protein
MNELTSRKPSFRMSLVDDPTHVVGIGASAGGLEALQALLQRFTADCTAFVVVMHLSPTHHSALASILAKCTPMSVTEATDSQVLKKNCIYVITPGFQLTLTDEGTLRLSALPSTYPRWTIDKFLSSLSEIGSAAIGVILSGTGSDGSQGLKEIRAKGGTTFVQDPASAASPQMPESARPFADYVLAPRALGDALMLSVGARAKSAQPAVRSLAAVSGDKARL